MHYGVETMAKQVPWNKIILEEFIDKALLTEDEEKIMHTRIAGWTRVQQSMEFGMSLATVDRVIRRLKAKYDHAQKYSPLLPVRKESAEELYMLRLDRDQLRRLYRVILMWLRE